MEIKDAVDLFQQYVLVERGLSPQTWVSYLEDLQAFFNYFSDKKDTSDLLETDLYEFLKFELSLGKSVSTALRRLSSTRSFYLFLTLFLVLYIISAISKSSGQSISKDSILVVTYG